MAIKMTPEETQAVKEGKKTIQDIIADRGQNPKPNDDKPKEKTELDKVKEELKKAYLDYKELLKTYEEIKRLTKENVTNKDKQRSVIQALKFRKQQLISAQGEKQV
jgi:hypothetical protein